MKYETEDGGSARSIDEILSGVSVTSQNAASPNPSSTYPGIRNPEHSIPELRLWIMVLLTFLRDFEEALLAKAEQRCDELFAETHKEGFIEICDIVGVSPHFVRNYMREAEKRPSPRLVTLMSMRMRRTF